MTAVKIFFAMTHFSAVFGSIFRYSFPCRNNMAIESFRNSRGKRSPLFSKTPDHPMFYLGLLPGHLSSTVKISLGGNWKSPSSAHGPLVHLTFLVSLPAWLVYNPCSIWKHWWMLLEFIVDLGDLRRMMKGCVIQHRGGLKPRDTKEAELSGPT